TCATDCRPPTRPAAACLSAKASERQRRWRCPPRRPLLLLDLVVDDRAAGVALGPLLDLHLVAVALFGGGGGRDGPAAHPRARVALDRRARVLRLLLVLLLRHRALLVPGDLVVLF